MRIEVLDPPTDSVPLIRKLLDLLHLCSGDKITELSIEHFSTCLGFCQIHEPCIFLTLSLSLSLRI